MFKLGFLALYCFVGCIFLGIVQATCVLTDAPNQCGAFCLSAQMPLIEHNRRMREQLDSIAAQLNATQAKLDRIEKQGQTRTLENEIQATVSPGGFPAKPTNEVHRSGSRDIVLATRAIPSGFELIGSRYFYIEHNLTRNRDNADDICRQKGGRLAVFGEVHEMMAVLRKLDSYFYWLVDTRNQPPHYEKECLSVLDLHAYPYFDWIDCKSERYFICQLDN